MNVNPIYFQKVYKINTSKKEFHQLYQYLEKNSSKNKTGFPLSNSNDRIFDDMKKDESNFRYEDDNGNLYILSGNAAITAWGILFNMMDCWACATKDTNKLDKADKVFKESDIVANQKIKELIVNSSVQELEVSWINKKPKFSIVC